MPRSKSKRSRYIPPKPAKPKPSPRWVPVLGVALIGLGVALVIANYVVRLPGGNFNLVAGFVLMAGGLGVLSQWH
ncbi:MAG TPA: cell division protein CrgA [Egibacteraceae bacterium]|nr:cell division protein CrgA [Actinomycetota bacterium]HWB73134.1 cell division protein CrgA [Egibacteraceae bacterium]